MLDCNNECFDCTGTTSMYPDDSGNVLLILFHCCMETKLYQFILSIHNV